MDALPVGRRYVRALSRANKLGYVACAALFGVGLFGFSLFNARSDWLAKHGVHARGTVTGSLLGRRKLFRQHIDVTFRTRDETTASGRIYVGEDDRYDLGQRVDILYDPATPSHVRLLHSDNLSPLVAFPIFAALFGLIGLVLPIKRGRKIAAVRRVLERDPEQLPAWSTLGPSAGGRWTVRRVYVDREGYESGFMALRKRGWNLPDGERVTASVFAKESGFVVLVLHPESRSAAARYE